MKNNNVKFKINFYFLTIVFSLAFLVFNLNKAQAAKLFFDSKIQEAGIGQEFQIDLMLDAEEQDINAVEGKVIFPENLLEFKEIYTGNSIINFWIGQPAQKNGEIIFSGIIPGGFSGVLSPYYKGKKPGKVFSLFFKAKSGGGGNIGIKDARILLNDGNGAEAAISVSNFKFQVSGSMPDAGYLMPDVKKDFNSPELFIPEISRDPSLFNNKWFLVFSAQDKNSGIDHYEIAEKRGKIAEDYAQLPWQTAESPYLLADQNLKSYIYVKAVDKSGNARIIYLPPTAPWYKKLPVYKFVSLGVILVVLLIIWLWRLRKNIKYH